MKKLLIILFVFAIGPVWADPPIIVDPETGKYLGTLSTNKYDPNSVSNPYGRYGSKFSPDSINNPYSVYGNPYSNKSVNNPYATSAPVIIDPGHQELKPLLDSGW